MKRAVLTAGAFFIAALVGSVIFLAQNSGGAVSVLIERTQFGAA